MEPFHRAALLVPTVKKRGIGGQGVRVAINALFWGEETTGSGHYIRNLLQALAEIDGENEYVLVMPRGLKHGRSFQGSVIPGRVKMLWRRTPFDGLSNNLTKLWFEQITFPNACRRARADLAFVPYFAPPFFSPVPVVVTIHDLIPLILPAYRGSIWVQRYMCLVSSAARRMDLVLTDSVASVRDIVRLLNIPSNRTRVIPLAAERAYRKVEEVDELARVRALYDLPSRYLLYLGGFDVRKNVKQVLTAYARARSVSGFPDDVWLVVAGKLPSEHIPFTPDPRVISATLGITDRVLLTGWIEERDKPVIYSEAIAFLFPSYYEGFGLPPLEALSCGVPVITSDVSALPEVIGDAGLTVSPDDVDALMAAIFSVVVDEHLRERLKRSALVQAERFSWDWTARQTLRCFEEVVRGR